MDRRAFVAGAASALAMAPIDRAPPRFATRTLYDEDFVVVTRDLFADFGEFTFTGIALSPVDGEAARYDHIYLGKSLRDFELAAPKR